MAGVDKLRISDWSKYLELRNWLISKGSNVKDDYGNVFEPINFLADYTEDYFKSLIESLVSKDQERYDSGEYKSYVEDGCMTREEYDNYNPRDYVDIPIMNNPIFFDVWLIRYCPLDWLQGLLKKQYSRLYDSIKSRTSLYDTYNRNGLGKNIKVKLPKYCKDLYCIEIIIPNKHELSTYFDCETKSWHTRLEPRDCWCSSNIAAFNDGVGKKRLFKRNRKSIYRLLQKWDLPKDTSVILYYMNNRKPVKTIIKNLK